MGRGGGTTTSNCRRRRRKPLKIKLSLIQRFCKIKIKVEIKVEIKIKVTVKVAIKVKIKVEIKIKITIKIAVTKWFSTKRFRTKSIRFSRCKKVEVKIWIEIKK